MSEGYARLFQQLPESMLNEVIGLAGQQENLINLSIGDPDMRTPIAIIEEANQKALAGETHYTDSQGLQEFRQQVCQFYKEQHDLTISSNQVMATIGALHALGLALKVLLNKGDEVVLISPYFSPYEEQVYFNEGVPVVIDTLAENGFQVTKEQLDQAITAKTKAVIINSPNNPTGAVLEPELLAYLGQRAEEAGFYVLSDEVYESYDYSQTFTTMLGYAPNQTILLHSFSKTFAMTGFRIGYLVAPEEFINRCVAFNDGLTYSAPTLAQYAAIYALKHYQPLSQPLVETFQKRLAYMEKRVADIPYLSMAPVAGGMYGFIDISKTGKDSLAVTQHLLKECQVLVLPGIAFGKAGDNHIRVAGTRDIKELAEAFDRMSQLTWSN